MSLEGAHVTPELKDVRTAFLQEKGAVPEYDDYAAWQRSSGLKSSPSTTAATGGVTERPTSPQTEIVRLQIKARRKTLQQYQKMQSKLVTCNLELMGVIQENEGDVHDQVTALLEQYEKFRGAIGNIRSQSEESVKQAKLKLEETKERTTAELDKLESEFKEIERKVIEKANECEVLVKFKGTDKEYHLRVARVNELRMEQENLNTEQKTERSELAQLVQRHHTNLNATIDKRCKEIQAALTANAVKNIPDTLRELAHQNRVMQREMVLHKDSILETEGEIERLKAEISVIKGKAREMSTVLPVKKDICTPETELSLDIPTYKMLPV